MNPRKEESKQTTLAESSNGFYANKTLVRTYWTGGGKYKEVDE